MSRAYERDDAGAIADVAYNLALAQMKAGDAKAALATVRDARGRARAAARRDARRSSSWCRRRPPIAAAISAAPPAAAQEVLDRPAKDPDTVPRAWFIRGLVAADRRRRRGPRPGDRRPPAQPSRPISKPTARSCRAAPRCSANRPAEALALFEQSAGNRQQALDYRGMARALSFAGDAALRSNRAADAADFFLRAGRSSLLQGDTATALPLLKRAEDLARQTAQTGIVEEVARLRKVAAERAAKA